MKALTWLRGTSDVKEELEDIKRAFRQQQAIGNVSYIKLFADKVYLLPFLIMIALMFFQQCAGVNAVLFYLKVSKHVLVYRFNQNKPSVA